MSTFSLRAEGSATFKKIYHQRKWVGRVVRTAAGDYYARIGQGSTMTEARGATEVEAFETVVSKHLGYASASALRANNAKVRRQNSAARARAQHAFHEMLHGNFQPLDAVLGLKDRTGE